MYGLADVLQSGIAHESAGKESGLAENLETVADPEDEASIGCKFADRFHHWREFGDCTGAEIIAVGEATGNDDCVTPLQVRRVVPEEGHGLLGDFRDGPKGVVITVGTGEDDDAKFHCHALQEGVSNPV